MVKVNVSERAGSEVNSRPLLGGPDTGRWNIDKAASSSPAHEFGHLLGVDNKSGYNLLNNDPGARSQRATAYDYGWAFGGAINAHRSESRPAVFTGRQLETLNAGGAHWGAPTSYTSTRQLRAGLIWWR